MGGPLNVTFEVPFESYLLQRVLLLVICNHSPVWKGYFVNISRETGKCMDTWPRLDSEDVKSRPTNFK